MNALERLRGKWVSSLRKIAGWMVSLILGGDGFGRHVVEVVAVIGSDESREEYLVVGDFDGEGEGDFFGSFPGRSSR